MNHKVIKFLVDKIKHVDVVLPVALWYDGWNCKESKIFFCHNRSAYDLDK